MCYPTAEGAEEDATLVPTSTVGRASLVGSRVTRAVKVEARRIFKGVSSSLTRGWSVVQGLFKHEQLEGANLGLGFTVATQDDHRAGTDKLSCFAGLLSRLLLVRLWHSKSSLTQPLLGRWVGLQHEAP